MSQNSIASRTEVHSDLREKLYFLHLAAENKDFTEIEFIVNHLTTYLSRREMEEPYLMAKNLEVSITAPSEFLLDEISEFIYSISEMFDLPVNYLTT